MGPRPEGRGRCARRARYSSSFGFNGATARRPWTAARSAGSLRSNYSASMGPRPEGRGRLPHQNGTDPSWRGFNGATARRPWTGVYQPGRGRPSKGFNGATARRPWTVLPHVRVVVRIERFNGATARRPWTAGAPGWSSTVRNSFNGATARRPWTGGQGRRTAAGSRASMGPRPEGRGRCGTGVVIDVLGLRLQWGHGPKAVDGGAPPICVPSARPRLQWGHGPKAVDGAPPIRTLMMSIGFNGATARRPWTAVH